MYKRRLHELCQKRQWEKPLYTSSWVGPDHSPLFRASVTVNGVIFDGPKELFRTQREAQNEVARLAIDQLLSSSSAEVTAPPPSSRPLAEPSCSSPAELVVDENPSKNGESKNLGPDVVDLNMDERGSSPAELVVDENPSKNGESKNLGPDVVDLNMDERGSSPAELVVDENPSKNGESKNLGPDVVDLNMDERGSSPAELVVDENPSKNGESKNLGPDVVDLNMDERGSSSAKLEVDENPSKNGESKNLGPDVVALNMDEKEILHLYKGLLQNYAQKRGLGMPAYDNESMGQNHGLCFKASVTVGGQTFRSPQFFSLLKDAEHAAAKVAVEFFSSEGNPEEGRFYKNLLSEMAQKEGIAIPVYDTVSDGLSHMPTFASTVEIKGERFQGSVMKTKKQAENDAAKVAWTRLRERKQGRIPGGFSSRFQVITIDDVSPSPPPLPSRRAHQDEAITAQKKNQSDPPGGGDIGGGGGGGELAAAPCGRRQPSSPPSDGDDEISSGSASVEGTSEFTARSEEESSASGSRIIVCPRGNSSKLPAGARLLPFSDDMWMAVTIE